MSDYTDDAYQILGVSPTATERDIKVAYRKLALQYHPDRQSDAKQRDMATTKFVKIANAYEVLTDPYLRAEYNERRHSAIQEGHGNMQAFRRQSGPRPLERTHYAHTHQATWAQRLPHYSPTHLYGSNGHI